MSRFDATDSKDESVSEQTEKIERLVRKIEDREARLVEVEVELESTYKHLRAVIENCKHTPVEAIRHQLVGLLPECQEMEPEMKQRMREQGMGHLVDRHDEQVRQNWKEYGYGE